VFLNEYASDTSQTDIIPLLIRNFIPSKKSPSVIFPSAHQPALFFTQAGIE